MGTDVSVRTATLDDAPALAAIYEHYVLNTSISFEEVPPSTDEFTRRMKTVLAYAPWLVALIDGAIVGYAYASRHAERAAYRWGIDVGIYIDQHHHRRGIGRRLYAELLPIAERLNYRRAYAGITLPNDASVALHRAFGFELIGTYRRTGWKYGSWHDVGWFGRDIGSETEGKPPEPLIFENQP
jgi:L-amino acid N-acyltransferase YncA